MVTDLWERIKPFASYGFNKSHAASYGMVAYQTAYMKANYPVQYMTAVLRAEFGDSDKVAAIVNECRNMNIQVLPPDVNESFRNFAMVSEPGEPGIIRFGLTAIKNVGGHIVEVIYKEKKEHGPYKDLEDFLTRVKDKDLNKKSVESLVKAGALDCFGIDRGKLLANSENILLFSKQIKERDVTNQGSLFSGTSIALDTKVVLKDGEDVSMEKKLQWEKELLGVYISSHPFLFYQEKMRDTLVPLSAVEEQPRDAWVVIGGIVASVKKKVTKKGSIMLFVTIEDTTGNMELLVFPKTFERTKPLWVEGNRLCIVGKTPKEVGDNKVFAENVYVLNKENAEEVGRAVSLGKSSVTTGENQRADKSVFIMLTNDEARLYGDDLKMFFGQYPGDHQVFIKLPGNTIKANSKILWNEKIAISLEEIVGPDKYTVVNGS
ncbi:MAG: hypothetical protein COU68_04030 [Candidatus Pacebacteria bacterium CG10_big_fil_rev_8_21_14_0_10_45_6]|nr:MAG: hypothetical protein COU68_04030 [Candidatus Pacebacteria bacterium CG10_big_fil_rev_8_21_14_0_10_45_6]